MENREAFRVAYLNALGHVEKDVFFVESHTDVFKYLEEKEWKFLSMENTSFVDLTSRST